MLAGPRMSEVGRTGATNLVLLKIPVRRALTEEILFRGVLLMMFQPLGTPRPC